MDAMTAYVDLQSHDPVVRTRAVAAQKRYNSTNTLIMEYLVRFILTKAGELESVAVGWEVSGEIAADI